MQRQTGSLQVRGAAPCWWWQCASCHQRWGLGALLCPTHLRLGSVQQAAEKLSTYLLPWRRRLCGGGYPATGSEAAALEECRQIRRERRKKERSGTALTCEVFCSFCHRSVHVVRVRACMLYRSAFFCIILLPLSLCLLATKQCVGLVAINPATCH